MPERAGTADSASASTAQRRAGGRAAGGADLARGSLDEVRQVARRLRRECWKDLGLASAMRVLVTDFSETSRLLTSITLDPRLPPLGPAAELVIYRVVQEGLTNIARQAGAHTSSCP